MNKQIKIAISIFAAILLLGAGLAFTDTSPDTPGDTVDNEESEVVIYKSPTCGCCDVYSSYIKREGYNVETKNIQDMSAIKQEFGVPHELESCHTMEVGEYIVEGHVPEEAIQKLLAEKPDIKGIGMPGMPSGSPGMSGPKMEDFVIYEITHENTRGDIFLTI